MIQRIQSVWLLLAAGFEALTFKLPFSNGDYIKDKFQAVVDLKATTTIWLTILSVLLGLVALVTIYMIKNLP